jgi:hypothetical protein
VTNRILSDSLDVRTERARAEHPELDGELRSMRTELDRILAVPAGATDNLPLVAAEALSVLGRNPRVAALHDFAAQRRLIRQMRDVLGLLRDEPAARALAAWLLRRSLK